MMSRHFGLSSELPGAIAKRLPHSKNHLSGLDSLFNQFVTDIIYYTAIQAPKLVPPAKAKPVSQEPVPTKSLRLLPYGEERNFHHYPTA